MTSPALEMRAISKTFGPTRALKGVDLAVEAGSVHALLGENGAGKSTLMKILSGAYRPDSGVIRLEGREVDLRSPHAAREAGIAMIYQELNLAPHLSVEDNIMLGRESAGFGWVRRSAQKPRVREALARLGHPDLSPDRIVGELSVGMQQLVEIARALVFDARVIVFDEPTSSLTQADTARLFDVIRRLKGEGRAVIYISHFLEEIRQICDAYTVLRDGELAGTGRLAAATDAEIATLMIGRSLDELFPVVPHTPGAPLVTVTGLSGQRLPRRAGLELRRGEILGLAGLVGSGRTEFLRCLYGLDSVRAGEVRVGGELLSGGPASRMARGLGLVSEDRKGEGLAQVQSVADNLTASRLSPYTRWGWLRRSARDRAVRDWMMRLSIKARRPAQLVSELSGGNQQKIAIARVLHQAADIILLDEPTRGIDVGTKSEIYRLMGEAAADGKSVLFVSSYFRELLAVCDRIAVMVRGEIREVRPASEWTEDGLMLAATGGAVE
jgi:ribose transport system ATP-binding protein